MTNAKTPEPVTSLTAVMFTLFAVASVAKLITGSGWAGLAMAVFATAGFVSHVHAMRSNR